ncbi:RagB/SusD family nutrient uptake outer membrane protein [Sinomicrobium weinanense]|uniref:RagB/SusD family nutrient uptake outer membrane protein n=1 Tax=Sinomicrobium weinanense TaxID=2842200 RepID=A0A926JS28_9FLAO|nr:RagB/SusD family nutrient uptake outer membrane protein [Sinomicrobium weinanense]MBC9796423.1 RagB/SusD family nutrient uptake outer membrane protein [Sinomicrobium weinanense]MBU3125903.1 RagB/SusD family nutrient uptake outer membrane protein [Sinomicrobium weinanense]
MKKIVYIVLTLIVAAGCTNDFLDQEIPVKREIDAFYKTPEDIYGALMDDYSALQNDALANARWVFGDVATDDALKGGESAGDGADFEQIAECRPLANNSAVKDLWVQSYSGITKANIILDKIGDVDFSGQEDLKATYRAEALFLRAFNYYYIAMAFGDAPILTSGVTDFIDIDPELLERRPVTDIWGLIEGDLKEAIPHLPLRSRLIEEGQLGRATRAAGQALLAKTYMFQRKYTEAVPVLKEIVENSNYTLLDDYGTLVRPEGEFSTENIFEVNFINQSSGWGDDSEGSTRVVFQLSRDDWGYGFNQPTQDLVDEFEPGDPRLIYTVNWGGDEYEKGVPQGNKQYNPYGYSNRKIFLTASQRPANVFSAGKNEVIFRLADFYLLYAEALVQSSGDPSTALHYLNLVRQRANSTPKIDPERLVQVHTVEDVDLPMRTFTTKGQLLRDIYHERRVELGMEGIRWWDLVRQNRTGVLADYYQKWSVDRDNESKGDLTGKFYEQWVGQIGRPDYPVFPVPQTEIDASQGHLEQTAGY